MPCTPPAAPATEGLLDGTARNALVLSIDTLRRDHVGRYSGEPTTPFLDMLLSESTVLDDHRSCSDWTLPSMVCLLTGRSPIEVGFIPSPDPRAPGVPVDTETVETWLQDAGFATAYLTANLLVPHAVPDLGDPSKMAMKIEAPAETLVDFALDGLDGMAASGEPWFFLLHFNDPHSPWEPPEEYLEGLDELPPIPVDLGNNQEVMALAQGEIELTDEEREAVILHTELRYKGEIRYLDDQLARLWAELEVRNLLLDTVVVLTSDHGEQFFEHGEFTHGRSLHQEEVGALGAVWLPGSDPESWSGPTLTQDLTATLLEVLEVPWPGGAEANVVGAAPELRSRHGFHLRMDGVMEHVLASGAARLMYAWDGERELFDVEVDPGETEDRYDASDPEVACLWEQLLPHVEDVQALVDDVSPESAGP